LRITVSTLTPYPSGTAHVAHMTSTAQALVDLGHDVELVVAQPGPGWPAGTALASLGYEPSYRIRVLARRDYRGQSLVNGLRIRRLARRSRPDLWFADDVRCALAAAGAGAPTIFEVHSLHLLTRRMDRTALTHLLRMPALRGIVTISTALRDDLITHGVDPGLIHVAPEAASIVPASPTTDAPIDGARPNAVQVGYTGSLLPGRGIDLMVELARACPELDVHVMGGPPAESGRLAARSDRPTNLVVHGPRGLAEARRFQLRMDVLLAPYATSVTTPGGVDTARWMSPMKLFEYMAAGRAIVCSDLPVLREVVEDGVTAVLAAPTDVADWVAAVRSLAADPGRRERLGSRARAQVEQHHTWALRSERILAVAADARP
jgi:glycosyltransferase involved in cell wall biosynthesis